MLSNLKKTNTKGFTIIEVMIVLAIAGLILLIVLLAIPALQRNARNTAIKNDAAAVAAAVNEFKSNNDGSSPGITTTLPANPTNGVVTIESLATGSTPATAKVQPDTGVSGRTGIGPTALVPSGTLYLYKTARCDGTLSNRSVTIWYQVETSGAATQAANNKCVEA